MSGLSRISVADQYFGLDIFTADVTHVVYRGERPVTGPGRYQDLPNYLLNFLGRGELDSDATVYLNIKLNQAAISQGRSYSQRKFEEDHALMVKQLSKSLKADLTEHPQRSNLQTLALLHGGRPLETARFNPTNVPMLPVIVLSDTVARISIFSKNVKEPILGRDSMSKKIHGLVQWTGFEGFFEIDGHHTGLDQITNRDDLVQHFTEELKKAWEFLPHLNFTMVELNQIKKLDNIQAICKTWSGIPDDRGVKPYRVAPGYLPEGMVEVWKNVTIEFALSYLLADRPAHEVAVTIQPIYREVTQQPIIDVEVDTSGTVHLHLNRGEHNIDAKHAVTLVLPRPL